MYSHKRWQAISFLKLKCSHAEETIYKNKNFMVILIRIDRLLNIGNLIRITRIRSVIHMTGGRTMTPAKWLTVFIYTLRFANSPVTCLSDRSGNLLHITLEKKWKTPLYVEIMGNWWTYSGMKETSITLPLVSDVFMEFSNEILIESAKRVYHFGSWFSIQEF